MRVPARHPRLLTPAAPCVTPGCCSAAEAGPTVPLKRAVVEEMLTRRLTERCEGVGVASSYQRTQRQRQRLAAVHP